MTDSGDNAYQWVIGIFFGFFLVAVIIRCTCYAIYGADTGIAIIDNTGNLVFLNMDAVSGIALLQNIQTHGTSALPGSGLRSDNSLLGDAGVDNDVLPFYLDENHPCNSFYDAVCGIFDTDGTQSIEEDITASTLIKKRGFLPISNISKSRSSGTFYDVSRSSEMIKKAVIENASTYSHCLTFFDDTTSENISPLLSWNGLNVPAYNNESILETLFLSGLELPIILEVKKMFHLADFAVHLRLNPLPMIDTMFGSNHLDPSSLAALQNYYQTLLSRNGNLFNDVESVTDYMESCYLIDTFLTERPEEPVKKFLLTLQNILGDFRKQIPYLCFSTDLVSGLNDLNTLLKSNPETFWYYFHKLTILYHTVQTLQLADSFTTKSFKNINTNIFEGVPMIDYKLNPSELHKFYYDLPKQNSDKGVVATPLLLHIVKNHKEMWFLEKLKTSVVKDDQNYHFKTSHGMFSIKVSQKKCQLFKILPNITNLLGLNSNEDSIKPLCRYLVNDIQFDTVNKNYALATEVSLDISELKRSREVHTLVERILDKTFNLINQSTFQDIRTKTALLKKLENVVIRVMGPITNSSSLTWPESYYTLGFKNLETNDCLTLTPENIQTSHYSNSQCISLNRVVDSITQQKISLDIIIQQSFYMFANKFLLNKLKTKLPYLDYRNNEDLYRWDDLISDVPFPIVNAWYDPLHNTITIPIGISLFPMFRNIDDLDDAILGVVIGHELGHSLDHNGRFFDEYGNYAFNNTPTREDDDGLWFPKDLVVMKDRMNCLASQYGHPCGDENYGYSTMGEDIADQIGVLSGLMALLSSKQKNLNDQYLTLSGVIPIANNTIMREYFVNYARLWCGRSSIVDQCNQVENDPHALSKHRVNKTLKQIKAFLEAFQCKPSSKMAQNKDNSCIIYK